ncbi:membrane-spanning 4-domains subfamily A member 4D [Austrofundulus limnaeus]|uniref:Membrane-spanning 4-domains subfamily A member 4D n=1 Tax=Austrofundulus limnaeus TaxID=52670 RepID=A0A2I4B716_AUSLI|nr:PREDICTED: membrane-spanning 4-domains subfamily A member 4D-like [Austrofundulus limnaeus]
MEDTEPTTRPKTAGGDGNQVTNDTLMSGKPLHRFVQREPRCLGIVLLLFAFPELMMGFVLADVKLYSSNNIYIPFWQGTLFSLCGILSIYTELHPSKKMVSACLSMYAVALVGILVSLGYRIHFFLLHPYTMYRFSLQINVDLVAYVEGILFTSSLCVLGLLIFLIVIARFALKSTHTQLIVQYIPPPPQTEASH